GLARRSHSVDNNSATTRRMAVVGIDRSEPAHESRKTEADIERTSEEDIAGNAQHCLTSLLPHQWHHQLRTECLLYLALTHAPACALPPGHVPLGCLRDCDRGTRGPERARTLVSSHVTSLS